VSEGRLGPRLVVAGTHSGVGKTTVATGLMAALRRRGATVAAAKVGPDFIDPGYHALAAGRPPRNLDPWLSGPDLMGPLASRAAAGADLLVVEGVMGLFDGAADASPSSTADVARLLDAPVVLVVDAAAQAQSVAAVVHGFATLDRRVRIGGVVLNRVGSDSHEAMLREALVPLGIPVLGALRRDDRLTWRDRHLGLVPVVEHPAEVAAALDGLAAAVADRLDLEAVVRLAASAPERTTAAPPAPQPVGRARIAVAGGAAFSFAYVDNAESLAAAGAELVPFDPRRDERLPEGCDGVLVGGGFPEVYADELAANAALLADVRAHVVRGGAVWAECAGLLWLAERLDDHLMAGVVPTTARMTDRLTLGYRRARTTAGSPLGPAGTELRGHEFHYSTADPPGDALVLDGRTGTSRSGHATPRLLASYLHVHLAATPELAEAFVVTCVAAPPSSSSPGT
jgi:cobyrinic acid a,c-diamide synthase